MAWISVHDHVQGGKLREFSKKVGCSLMEALGILVSLWLWGLNNADKTGELRSADRNDVAAVLAAGLSRGLNPDHVVECLVKTGWLDERLDGLFLHDWDVWQEQWYKFQLNKENDARRKREARRRQKQQEPEQEAPAPALGPPENPPDRPPDNPPDTPPKPKRTKKAEVVKAQFADTVRMQQKEYDKLVEQYGEPFTLKCIEKLDLYKGSKGKTYKDDYKAILSWVVGQVEKDHPGLKKAAEEVPSGKNPFAEYIEEGGE